MEDLFLPKTQHRLEEQAAWLIAYALILLSFPPLFSLLCPCLSGGGTAAPLLELALCVRAGCSSADPG